MAEHGCGKWRRRQWRMIVIGLLLLSAGCTADAGSSNSGGNSGNDRNGGFYGGISGGGVRLQ